MVRTRDARRPREGISLTLFLDEFAPMKQPWKSGS